MTGRIGILLSGGESRRFGSPKAFAEIGGEKFYERAYQALDAVCDRVVIVAHPKLQSRFPDELDVITDLPAIAGQGPLAGILTAMAQRPGDCYIVLPCDMPFITSKETTKLVERMDKKQNITAIQTPDEKVPLFSIWKTGLQEALQEELAAGGRRVMVFMEKAGTAWLDSTVINKDTGVFRNINRPDE
ncbi:molybdenum cofactor guanylyltransferase [Planomicrobium sp. CPCC 101079]|uniref:molybdenum cofactor guanylyltransferase n=1 Tax=Planomicrobium sp. CPCC 101079 TaxID=2599618 RepID=UPI0011B4A60C|nr:molybdenum cofactor guanylyltransferase [Planomicrobium sp. CPCC 101079]TWT01792.1 molybdenum cofactor guanylyltransferase [Planomicrobium sp. CPCC 101079]